MLRLITAAGGRTSRATHGASPLRAGRRAFVVVAALMFAAGAVATVVGCASMATRAQPMPGAWMASMAAMGMCGQGASGALFAFVPMWLAMMVAMMSPTLAPVLWRHRSALERTGASAQANRSAAMVALGYFAVWTALGLVVFAFAAVAGEALVQQPAWSRAVPAFAGVVVTFAGALQFSAWKRHRLACWHAAPCGDDARGASVAWRRGVRLGLHCNAACANLTAVLLALGAMDLRAMAFVTAAITAERLAPRGACVVEGLGVVLVGSGAFMIGQAAA
ncbi:DUF2182 domain-containing protein [Dokdonella sp.]|uniref:DUF2182 domain-containing protein n=1 Tax=Dokdonella sp. TaxID=2291710 RepID=UPI002F418C0C